MRVCIVSSSFYPAIAYGGPISATWGLSKKLAENGLNIYVSTTNANGSEKLDVEFNKYLKRSKLYIKYYNEEIINKFSLSFIFGIYKDIKDSDIVYIQYVFHYTSLVSFFVSLLSNKKIIICPRGSFSRFTLINKYSRIKNLWLNFFFKPFLNRIYWHASSYLEKNDIKAFFPFSNVYVVNDGIDVNSFQSSDKLSRNEILNRYTGKSYDRISEIFFSLGRLHEIKGFDIIISAFDLYLKKDVDAKLIIAGGDNGVLNDLLKMIKKLGIENSVFLIGPINFNEKKILLNNCDFFVLASHFESFGIVVAEALACGLPVIVSNKTPWKDIEINHCGIFVENDNLSLLNAFMKVKRLKFKKHNIKRYVREKYDWKVISLKFINFIKSY